MTPPPRSEAAQLRGVVCIAGTSSGVGKSSMVVGIAAALRQKGLTVQAFKVGPDFIDPMHHQEATGRPSINLDSWMLSREQVLAAYHRAMEGADVAIVEGVMGLFDGRDGATEQGSTAQLAKWLGAPVVLVLDASALARSAAAVAKGYIEFDPDLRLAGLLFNKVGGAAHTQWLRDAMAASGIQAAVLGGVPKSAAVEVPERHLGLHMPGDHSVPPNLVQSLADLVSGSVDLDALLALAATAEVPPAPVSLQEEGPCEKQAANGEAKGDEAAGAGLAEQQEQQELASEPAQQQQQQASEPAQQQQQQQQAPVRIAVARDAAFCFYYNDNLNLLRRCGADLVFFSPLADPLPPNVAGVYIGGGYPERHAAELAENRLLRASLAAFARAGGVVYAECGGLMYLSKSVQPTAEEPPRPMVGVFPFKTVMSKMTMGYVEVETEAGCPLFPAGRTVRGQVYHFSNIVQESVVGGLGQALTGKAAAEQAAAWGTCYRVQPQVPGAPQVAEGFCLNNVLASYVHLHFGNCPDFAASLVDRCRGVDLEAVAAAVAEAAQTAAYLESAVPSAHGTPNAAAKGPRVVHHSRSSPDFTRDERLAAKQRSAAAEPHRGQSEDVVAVGRHHPGQLAAGDIAAHHMVRNGSLPPGVPHRSLSPATTLSKVVSMNSLSSYSPQIGVGALPPGETLSPPLSDSPQQLSPRELGQQAAAPPYFVVPPGALQQQQQQQQAVFGVPAVHAAHMQQQGPAYHPAAQGPPLVLDAYGGQRLPPGAAAGPGGQLVNSYSWPRLHHLGVPAGMAGWPGSAGYLPHQQQPPYPPVAPVAGTAFYAANGAPPVSAAWTPPGGSRHSRTGSYERPPGGMLPARSPSCLELPAALDQRHLALSATPYNWQHSHSPSDKIVSLSPGATETLWALGLGARLAAVSDACDYPPDVVARAKARRSFHAASLAASLDRLGASPSLSTAASRRESPTWAATAQRGAASAAQLAAAAACSSPGGRCSCGQPHLHSQQQQPCKSEYVVDEEVLARERPGLLVYEQQQGEGCQPGGAPDAACGMGQAVVQALVAVGLQHSCRVVCMQRRTLSDVLEAMLVVGEAAGVGDEALRTVDRLRSRLRRVAGEAAEAAASAPSRPRVLVLQSLRPLRTVGWWLPDQVTLAGGSCWPEEQPGDAPLELTWEQVQAFAPEVLVIAGMKGGSALGPLTDLCTTASLPGWWLLPAVRSSAVFVVDAPLLCRAGPRLVDGVECLARMLWEDAAPGCACPDRAVLKLSLRPGQRCRPRLLPNHFVPFT